MHINFFDGRIGQMPQNDVIDAIPQRLPGDLQSVFFSISISCLYLKYALKRSQRVSGEFSTMV